MSYNANYKEYIFECDWYNEWDDKEIHSCAIIMAPSYHEAVEAIEERLPEVTHLHISELDERRFIWISQDTFNALSENPDKEI